MAVLLMRLAASGAFPAHMDRVGFFSVSLSGRNTGAATLELVDEPIPALLLGSMSCPNKRPRSFRENIMVDALQQESVELGPRARPWGRARQEEDRGATALYQVDADDCLQIQRTASTDYSQTSLRHDGKHACTRDF